MISFGPDIIEDFSSVRLDASMNYDIVLPFLDKSDMQDHEVFCGELHLKADQKLWSPLFTVVDRYVQTNGGNDGVNFTGQVLFFVESFRYVNNIEVCIKFSKIYICIVIQLNQPIDNYRWLSLISY